MLDDHDLASDDYNIEIAYGQIALGYCGVDDSGNRMHPDEAIADGLDTD